MRAIHQPHKAPPRVGPVEFCWPRGIVRYFVLPHGSESFFPRSATGPQRWVRLSFPCPGKTPRWWCTAVKQPHESYSSIPQSATGPLGRVRLNFPCPGKTPRWCCTACALPHESHSSTPRSATGPQVWVRWSFLAQGGSPQVAPAVVVSHDSYSSIPQKRHRNAGMRLV